MQILIYVLSVQQGIWYVGPLNVSLRVLHSKMFVMEASLKAYMSAAPSISFP